MKSSLCLLLFILAALPLTHAANHPAPVEGDYVIKNFRFASGETLPELRLHYRTIGTPVRDASGGVRNAVLILHGTGGSGGGFLGAAFAGVLFEPGQLLDGASHYIVLPDGIGHGKSSKPSDGLRARFPRYTYEDMIVAQHRLLTEHLGVNHLRLVMGTSMGAMHTWMWGEMYPDFMDALMPLASNPVEIAGRNRVLRKMILDSISTDPEWRGGDYTTQPRGLANALHIVMLMTSSPLQWQSRYPTRAAADAFVESSVRSRMASADANDMIYQYDASREYNPAPKLETIQAPLLAINSADDLVNPPELGMMEREIRRVKRGRFILIPTSDKTRGHGTHSLPELWKQHLADLLRESER
jgi:homoserine O-acetyltransferase